MKKGGGGYTAFGLVLPRAPLADRFLFWCAARACGLRLRTFSVILSSVSGPSLSWLALPVYIRVMVLDCTSTEYADEIGEVTCPALWP